MRKLIENCISSIACLSKLNPASHNKFNLNNCMQVIFWHHQYCEYLKICKFFGGYPPFCLLRLSTLKIVRSPFYSKIFKMKKYFRYHLSQFFLYVWWANIRRFTSSRNSKYCQYFTIIRELEINLTMCQNQWKHQKMLPKSIFRCWKPWTLRHQLNFKCSWNCAQFWILDVTVYIFVVENCEIEARYFPQIKEFNNKVLDWHWFSTNV